MQTPDLVFEALVTAGSNCEPPAAEHIDRAIKTTSLGAEIEDIVKQYNGGLITFAEFIGAMRQRINN